MTNLASTPQATIRANASRVATIQKFKAVTQTEFVSEIEQPVVQPSGAQEFQYSLNEPATAITETSLVEVKKAVRTISESAILVNESLARKVTHSISDSASVITEDLDSLRTVSRTFFESKTIDESLQKSVKRVRTISEPATVITEDLDANTIYPKILSPETTVITETSLVKVAKKIRNIIEPPTTIQESLIHLKAVELTEAHIPITESLQSARVFAHSISEPAIAITESLARKVIHPLSQTTAITEDLAKSRIVAHQFIENTLIGSVLGPASYTPTSFTFSFINMINEVLRRLVHRVITEPSVAITEQLIRSIIQHRTITEEPINISDSITSRRFYFRSINPTSFTSDSFTTETFGSFNIPSDDVVEISEELEAFVLPSWQKVLIEPAIEITESLDALKIPAPIVITPYSTGTSRRRRARPSWMGPIPTILQHRPITREEQLEPEERIPILTEIDIKEVPTQITEALSAVKITSPLPIPIIPPTPRVASIPEPEPYFEPIPLLQASTLLPLDQEPETQQPNALQPEKEPEERLEPVSISAIPPKKSKAAASLNTLEKLLVITELEAMIP